jgi:hypothetical protein
VNLGNATARESFRGVRVVKGAQASTAVHQLGDALGDAFVCVAAVDGRRCYRGDVKTIRAHVQNGQIVPDDPIELPEGAAVEVLLPDQDELTAQERVELEAAVEASAAEFERGEFEDAHAFALRLVAKS